MLMKPAKIILLLPILLCLVINAKAQDAGDFAATALDISRTSPGGSARILGLGQAQTALGGDISSISSNPAGLGFFNRSEFSFTPSFNYLNTNSKYQGSETTDGRLNFNFGNLGAIIHSGNAGGKLKSSAFGISINRVADFQNQINYEGFSSNAVNGDGQIIFDINRPADFVEYAVLSTTVNSSGQLSFGNDFAELAYETFLISAFELGDGSFIVDRDFYATDQNGDLLTDGNGNLIPAYSEPEFPVFQSETIKSTGATYQTTLAYGGNYNDRLYFGANIGILSLTREVERTYTEIPTNADLNNLVLEDNYEMNGTGVLATFGLIGRPINSLLLGFSYTTPSFYSIEQVRSITLSANFVNANESFGFDYEPFSYVLTTPSKLRLGATYFFGKFGFITGEIERVNYAGARLSNADDGVSFSNDNTAISDFKSATNVRIGTEFRYDIFRFRGGINYLADPTNDNIDNSDLQLTFGGGIRTEDYFVDMAILTSQGQETGVSPYPGQQALVTNKNTAVSFTVGFFF